MNLESVKKLAADIMAAQRRRRIERHRKIYEPRSTTASSLGYRCERRLVYARINPHYADPIGDELCSIFEEGDIHEQQIRKELIDLGFEALQAQRYFRDEKLEIGGKIDGMLPLSDDHRAELVPIELKSCSGAPPNTADGLRDHQGLYGRYYAQMQIYLYLTATDFGIFLFKNKITGLWTLVVVQLDYDAAEQLLKKAERVRDHVRSGTIPDRIDDRSECPGCPFRNTICYPEQATIDPLLLVNDKELIGQLTRREHLQSRAREFKRIDSAVKQRFRLTDGTCFVVGDIKTGFYVRKKVSRDGSIRFDIDRMSDENLLK